MLMAWKKQTYECPEDWKKKEGSYFLSFTDVHDREKEIDNIEVDSVENADE